MSLLAGIGAAIAGLLGAWIRGCYLHGRPHSAGRQRSRPWVQAVLRRNVRTGAVAKIGPTAGWSSGGQPRDEIRVDASRARPAHTPGERRGRHGERC